MKYMAPVTLFVLALVLSGSALTQTDSERAKRQLGLGVQAYKQYQYESAADHFRWAHQLDPESHKAVLYLAMALAQEYVPGVDAPDNMRWAAEATDNFKQVLEVEPQNVTALGWLGFIAMETRKYEEARGYYHQASQANPNNPEIFYAIGVTDWMQAHKRRFDERSKRGLSMGRPPSITQPFCAKLRTDNLPLIEDGIQMFNRVLELRADDDDAMTYLSLLYRERAEIECHDQAARSADERRASQWTDKGLAIRKQKFEKYKETEASASTAEPATTSAAEASTSALELSEQELQPPPVPPAPPPPPPPPPKKPIRVVH